VIGSGSTLVTTVWLAIKVSSESLLKKKEKKKEGK
jgi:hypothetical protein